MRRDDRPDDEVRPVQRTENVIAEDLSPIVAFGTPEVGPSEDDPIVWSGSVDRRLPAKRAQGVRFRQETPDTERGSSPRPIVSVPSSKPLTQRHQASSPTRQHSLIEGRRNGALRLPLRCNRGVRFAESLYADERT